MINFVSVVSVIKLQKEVFFQLFTLLLMDDILHAGDKLSEASIFNVIHYVISLI